MKRLLGSGALLVFAAGLIGCGPATEAEDDAAAHAEDTHELHLESGQIQDWGIRVGGIETTTIAAELALPGALTVNENRTARVAPLVAGQLSAIYKALLYCSSAAVKSTSSSFSASDSTNANEYWAKPRQAASNSTL